MTIQIKDSFYHADREFTIITCSTPLYFDPIEFGIVPTPYTTACHRGYWCKYSIRGNHLVLQDLSIYSRNNIYPSIVNVNAIIDQIHPHFPTNHRVYENLMLPMHYTGRILIGNHSVPTHHIKGVSGAPWQYKFLTELILENGRLVEIIDQSETAEDIRKFIRTMSFSEPERGLTGTYVRFSLPILGLISDYPWWIELN